MPILSDEVGDTIASIYAYEIGEASSREPARRMVGLANLNITIVLAGVFIALKGRTMAKRRLDGLELVAEDLISWPRRERAKRDFEDCTRIISRGDMLLCASLLVSSKYFMDVVRSNRAWADVMVVDLSMLNLYERILLNVLSHSIVVESRYIEYMLDRVAKRRPFGGLKGIEVGEMQAQKEDGCGLKAVLKRVLGCTIL